MKEKSILDKFGEEIFSKPKDFNEVAAELDAEEKYLPICEEIIKYTYRLALEIRRLRMCIGYEQKYVIDSVERNKNQLFQGIELLEVVHARIMKPYLEGRYVHNN